MPRIPSYRLHKRSGQALVELNGTPGSRERYDRLIAEYLSNGRRVPAWAKRRAHHQTLAYLSNCLALTRQHLRFTQFRDDLFR